MRQSDKSANAFNMDEFGFSSLTVTEIKLEWLEQGLSQGGNKLELYERLLNYMETQAELEDGEQDNTEQDNKDTEEGDYQLIINSVDRTTH